MVEPEVVGVPEISPVLIFKFNPGGREGEIVTFTGPFVITGTKLLIGCPTEPLIDFGVKLIAGHTGLMVILSEVVAEQVALLAEIV